MGKKKRRRRRPRTVAILPLIGLGAGLAEPVGNIIRDPSEESIKNSLNHICMIYTGFNPIEGKFDFGATYKGLMPLVAGILAHKVCNAIGINRTFANMPSPLNKLRL